MKKLYRLIARTSKLRPDILSPFQICTTGGTPVVLVGANVRVENDPNLPPGIAYFIDGETFCVNGEYPYKSAA